LLLLLGYITTKEAIQILTLRPGQDLDCFFCGDVTQQVDTDKGSIFAFAEVTSFVGRLVKYCSPGKTVVVSSNPEQSIFDVTVDITYRFQLVFHNRVKVSPSAYVSQFDLSHLQWYYRDETFYCSKLAYASWMLKRTMQANDDLRPNRVDKHLQAGWSVCYYWTKKRACNDDAFVSYNLDKYRMVPILQLQLPSKPLVTSKSNTGTRVEREPERKEATTFSFSSSSSSSSTSSSVSQYKST